MKIGIDLRDVNESASVRVASPSGSWDGFGLGSGPSVVGTRAEGQGLNPRATVELEGVDALGNGMRMLALAVGGALGANARYWLGLWIVRRAGVAFPWATLLVNVSGSFAIGLLAPLLASRLPHEGVRLLVLVGFVGAYTTFSTFTLEALALWERGVRGPLLVYLFGSVAAGLLAVALGAILGQGLASRGADPGVRVEAERPARPPG